MRLLSAIEAYITLKRALGAVFSVDVAILHSFARRVGDIPVEAVSPEMCQTFCRGKGPATRFWERKHGSLRSFFGYLVGRGHLAATPVAEPGPRIRSNFRPHIYSPDELRRLLDATAGADPRGHLQSWTVRTLLLLLYATGLRVGEALRLRRCDVDLRDRVLSIWNTKFFKSRLVPIGKQLSAVLERYWNERERLPLSDGDRSTFFVTRTGKAIPLARLESAFDRLRKLVGVRRSQMDRRQPRLHDLRATFAVHRLIAWYREGADVQNRLPFLSTYLGHINVSGTQTYLTMTAELLGEASLRFQRYASPVEELPHE